MPLPFRPSELCATVPSATSSLCDRLLAVFLKLPALLCQWAQYMFNEDGTVSSVFINEVQSIPTGMIVPRLSTVVPAGWLACNGQEVRRTDFPLLFSVIGTSAGAGNGTTTFNVPDLRQRVIVGYDGSDPMYAMAAEGGEATHVLTAAEMRHFHGYGDGSEDSLMDGSFCIRPWSAGTVVGTGVHNIDITPVPGLGPAISSGRLGTSDSLTAATAADAHSSLQPFTCAQYLIKT